MAHEPMHAYRVDQATRLRELMRQKSRRAITLAITSGKGGVGKSNVAVNLSICLASRGLRVTLVDVDMGLANADVLMNISPRFTLSHVLAGTHDMEEICVDGHGGVRFAAGASGRNDLADISEFERHNLLKQFQKLHRSADIVVLDCGAGISKNVIGFAQSSDRVMVVTTPQPTAMADAYATIKVLHREGYSGRVGMLTNMANSRSDAEAAYRRISGVAKRFLRLSVADDGYMLHDTAVELAVRDRCPFVIRFPGSNASACMAAVSARMVPGASRHRDRGGFFKRVAGLFV